MQLRWYQDEAVYSVFDYFERGGTGNPIIAMPTGTGKSLVIAEFLQRVFRLWPRQRVIMLTHVKELIEQNAEELMKLWPLAPLGIYSAGLKQKDIALPIIFGGIQSVAKNPEAFGWRDLVIIDECHLLSPNDDTMYRKAIAALKKINPWIKVIGLSATPFRMRQGMLTDGGLFTDICYDITGPESFNRLIAEGYLSPLVAKPTKTVIDLSGVSLGADNDFKKGELEKATDKDEITYGAVKETCEFGHDRHSWLTFGAGIANCEHLTSMFQSFGVSTVAVHSDYSNEENKQRINAWKRGEFRNCVSMNKLTTGVNHPPIDLIADLQATCSPGKHVQKGGRGTRTFTGNAIFPPKYNCLYLDFARNTLRNGPINDPRIPNKPGKSTGDVPVRICDACGTYNHASARFCGGGSTADEAKLRGGCGLAFEFGIKIFASAYEGQVMASDAPIVEYYNVQRVLYSKHEKKNAEGVLISPPSIKVSYFCGLQMFTEWVCLEHSGMAGKRARDWWRQRHAEEPPPTTYEALQRTRELKVPARIRVWTNKKYPEVLGYEY